MLTTPIKLALAAMLALVATPDALVARPTAHPRPDLADVAAGTYDGSVISDARGSGQSDVTISVTKAGPNTVQVTSSYSRLPTFTIRLSRAMQTIQQIGTRQVFLLDLSRSPHHLDVTDDDASWSGQRR